uniref:ARP1504 n=1 Tax=Arundo donax TaxID=35708 RepID=A0A0A9E6P7_ARUDO
MLLLQLFSLFPCNTCRVIGIFQGEKLPQKISNVKSTNICSAACPQHRLPF